MKKNVIGYVVGLIFATGIALSSGRSAKAECIMGAVGTTDGETWAIWTPDGGWEVQPGYEAEWAEHLEQTKRLESGLTTIMCEGPYMFEVYPDTGLPYDGSRDPMSVPSYVHHGEPILPGGEVFSDPYVPIVETVYNIYISSDRVKEELLAELDANDRIVYDMYAEYMDRKCKHNYEFKETSVEPGCGTYGEDSYECSKCGITHKEDVAPIKHSFEIIKDVKATCTSDGYQKSVCKHCNEEKKSVTRKATGHSPKTDETTATWFKEGLSVTTCGVCGEELERSVIPSRFSELWNR